MPDPRYVPVGDAILATSWETAESVAEYPPDRGHKFYLVQHVEDWSAPLERIKQTWHLPLRKIAISRWLQVTIEKTGEEAVFIPNGLDSQEFGIDISPEQRSPQRLVMPWSEMDWKGSRDGLNAVKQAHR